MRKLAFILVAALALAGCNPSNFGSISAGVSQVVNAQVSQNQLDTARSAYDGAFLVPAVHYRELPLCKKGVVATTSNICAERAKVLKLQAADLVVQKGFDDVQVMVTAGRAGGSVVDAWNLLQSAISTATGLVAAYRL